MVNLMEVAAGIIWRGGRFLAARRPEGAPLAGYWEFPGGKIQAGETPAGALKRELTEELGIVAREAVFWKTSRHFSEERGLDVCLHFFHIRVFSREPVALEGQKLLWVSPEEAKNMDFLPADFAVLEELRQLNQDVVGESDVNMGGVLSLVAHDAGDAFNLLTQCGMGLACTTNIPLAQLLREEFEVPEGLLARVDVLLLNGKPVDSPDKAIVRDRARLALAAGLPGMAGLAMKSNSAVRGLRGGITYCEERVPDSAQAGRIEMVLYGLAQPLLAAHFLARGALLPAGKLAVRLAALLNVETFKCFLEGRAMGPGEAAALLGSMDADAPVFLRLEN
jgi:8-oxo-dGTP diphosphatase